MAEEKPKLTLILPLGGPGRKTPGQWWQKCEHCRGRLAGRYDYHPDPKQYCPWCRGDGGYSMR